MRSLGRLFLVVILQSLEELRGRLRCRIEKPAVTRPCGERPDLVIVAPSNHFEIAKPRRQVGNVGALHCGLDLGMVLRLALLDNFHGDEGQHDSRDWKRVQLVGAQSRVVRAPEAGADHQPMQLHNILHAPCIPHCADNSDDVHDGVHRI